MPVIGIIMPTHGAGAHLAAAVDSVRAQTFQDWTLVIVCDGVDDARLTRTMALAAADQRIVVAHQQPRAGVAAARNRGLTELGKLETPVEAIALLDHDDRWPPHTLATLMAALRSADPATVGVHGIACFIDETGQVVRPGELEAELRSRTAVAAGRPTPSAAAAPTTFANLVISNCIPVGTVLIRRASMQRVGGFDERAVPADDYDMWLRLARLGDFAFVDRLVMEYRQHAQPTWIRPAGAGQGIAYVRRKVINSPDNDRAQAALARDGFRICARWVMADAASQAARLVVRGRLRPAARQVLRAGSHLLAFLAGQPGPWHERPARTPP